MRIFAGLPEILSRENWAIWEKLGENHQVTLCLPKNQERRFAPGNNSLVIKYLPIIRNYYGIRFDLALTLELKKTGEKSGMDLVYLKQSRGLGLMIPSLVRKLKASLVWEVPVLLEETAFAARKKVSLKEKIYFHNLDFLYHRADLLLLPNEVLKRELVHQYGVEPKKIRDCPVLACREDYFEPSSREDLSGENRCLGVWLEGEDRGGLEVIVRAFALLKNPLLNLMVLGERLNYDELTSLAASLGVQEQLFLAQGKAKPQNFFRECEIMLVSGREASARICYQQEILSRIYRFLSWGKPVLAPDFGGLEFIPENRLGDLYPIGGSRELAEKIAGLLEKPVEPEMISLYAAGHFEPDKVAAKLEELFLGLVASSPR